MKERPILMSAPMVRAILDGRKSQTRRIVKPLPPDDWLPYVGIFCPTFIATDGEAYAGPEVYGASDEAFGVKSSYGPPGDRLWVKETWKPDPSFGYPPGTKPTLIDKGTNILYRATLPEEHPKYLWQNWRPSLFMCRWMSRITREITALRVERLQDISEADAIAEGLTEWQGMWGWPEDTQVRWSRDPVAAYQCLWESINGPGSWDANPFVWIIQFRRVK